MTKTKFRILFWVLGVIFCVCSFFVPEKTVWSDAAISGEESQTPAASSCNTTSVECSDTANGSVGIGQYDGYQYLSSQFTADGSTLCGVYVELFKTGSPTDNLEIKIYTDSGGSGPSAQFGSTLKTIAASSITPTSQAGAGSSPTFVEFDSTTTPTASTEYHLVINRSGSNDNSNYISWNRGDCTEEGMYRDANGADTWTVESAFKGFMWSFRK